MTYTSNTWTPRKKACEQFDGFEKKTPRRISGLVRDGSGGGAKEKSQNDMSL